MFIPDKNEKTVRVPAKIINGKAEYYYDSNLKLKEGALVDVIAKKIEPKCSLKKNKNISAHDHHRNHHRYG